MNQTSGIAVAFICGLLMATVVGFAGEPAIEPQFAHTLRGRVEALETRVAKLQTQVEALSGAPRSGADSGRKLPADWQPVTSADGVIDLMRAPQWTVLKSEPGQLSFVNDVSGMIYLVYWRSIEGSVADRITSDSFDMWDDFLAGIAGQRGEFTVQAQGLRRVDQQEIPFIAGHVTVEGGDAGYIVALMDCGGNLLCALTVLKPNERDFVEKDWRTLDTLAGTIEYRAAHNATAAGQAPLRSGPGATYATSGRVAAGQVLDIVARDRSGDWYKLRSGAWIAARHVDNAPANLPIATPEGA